MLELFGKYLRSPLFIPSGIVGIDEVLEGRIELSGFGFIVLKTITVSERRGNSGLRLWEVPCGMMNSIGLPNEGLEAFLHNTVKKLKEMPLPFMLSISVGEASELEVFSEMEKFCDLGIEINLSCPNISHKGKGLIAQDPDEVYRIISWAKKLFHCPVVAKLSPDVTFIAEVAKAAESAGCDAISLVNTFQAIAIDVNQKRPVFERVIAGMSGPAIFPLALKRVWEVYRAVKVPILGMGGVFDIDSVLQMAMAGAKAVGIGSMLYRNPEIGLELFAGLQDYLSNNHYQWQDIVGVAHGTV